mgnify:CR=1 FL=1
MRSLFPPNPHLAATNSYYDTMELKDGIDMGFRFIQEGSREYKAKMDSLKEQQFLEETKRWRNITATDESDEQHFIGRFQELWAKMSEKPELKPQGIDVQILNKAANIAKIQGNLEIAKVSALLDREPKERTPSKKKK